VLAVLANIAGHWGPTAHAELNADFGKAVVMEIVSDSSFVTAGFNNRFYGFSILSRCLKIMQDQL
jgi:hypothetical protein